MHASKLALAMILTLACPVLAAPEVDAVAQHAMHTLGTANLLLTLLALALAAFLGAAGFLGLSVLALASDSTRREVETLAAVADQSPRKAVVLGLVSAAATFIVFVVLMKAPVLRLLGLLLLAAFLVALVKGFISRIASAGRFVATRWSPAPKGAYLEPALGVGVLGLVFLLPVIGQLVVLLAVAQGLGAYVMVLAGAKMPATPSPAEAGCGEPPAAAV